MAAPYAKIPAGATLDIKPFQAHVSDEKLQHFRQLLSLSPIAPPVFENTRSDRTYGISRDWLEHAKSAWLNDFDWRKHEDRINSYPNFKATLKDGTEIQFLALFSEKPDAVPVASFHGWPSSVMEYMDVLDLLKERYSPADLPYHYIVPSLPGYAYSSGPPKDTDYDIAAAADAMNELMVGLGFGSGYIAQGGDLGSFVSRTLAMGYDACKGMHVTQMGIPPAEDRQDPPVDAKEKRAMQRAGEFVDTGFGFALEQGTRPATIGLVLSSSPLALLSWIGEKILAWTDEEPPLEKILADVTLYWMTDTIPRAFYHNRALAGGDDNPKIARLSAIMNMSALKLPFVEKPCGYSSFYYENVPVPKSWAEKTVNLVFFNEHARGGHFAAGEKPKELLDDVEEYIKKAWKTAA